MAFETLSDALMQGFINEDEFNKLYDALEKSKNGADGITDSFNDAAIAAMSALRSMQSTFDSGSQGYSAMGVAIEGINSLLAISAVLNQANGDPYTAFARMAAMIATVVSLGQSVGGYINGGGATSAEPSASPTTGTLLGDAEAASHSITNSLELLNDWSDLQYVELRGIHAEVKSLNDSLTSVTTAIVRSIGQFNEELYSGEMSFGTTPAFEFDNRIFSSPELIWGQRLMSNMAQMFTGSLEMFMSQALAEFFNAQGFDEYITQERFSAVLSAIPEHLFAQAFEDIFGKSQLTEALTFLPDFAADLFGSILSGVFGGEQTSELRQAGIKIGQTTIGNILAGVDATVQQYALAKISTSGGWFGSDSTSWAVLIDSVSGDTERLFNEVYERMAISLKTLATVFEVPLDVLESYSISAQKINLKDLTGEEIQEKLSEWASTIMDTAVADLFGGILSEFQKQNEGMYETAERIITDLAVVQALLARTGNSFDLTGVEAFRASERLVNLAGDLETLAEATQTYYEAFTTKGEQFQDLMSYVREIFSALNQDLPDNREGFTALIQSIDATTEEGAALYWQLLSMADAMNQLYTAQETISDTTQSLIDNLTGLVVPMSDYEQTVESITNTVEDAMQTWIDNGMAIDLATDAARGMINYFVGAVSAMNEAQEIAAQAQSTLESIQDYRKTLAGSTFTTLMPDEILSQALERFRSADLEDLPTLADTLLEAARNALANPEDYQRIFDEVTQRLAEAELEAQEQVDLASLQISILEEQIEQLRNVNSNLTSIEDLLSRFAGGGFAGGGISTGPESGHIEVLHGTEGVIPIEGGAIPVQVYGGGDDETKMLLKALIYQVSADKDFNRKIYQLLDRISGGKDSLQVRE